MNPGSNQATRPPQRPPQQIGASLLKLLAEQLGLYRQLAALAQQQSRLVGADDPQRLLELLGSRQRLVDQLLRLGKALGPAKAQWQQCQDQLPEPLRRQAQDMIDQVGALLAEIIAVDERDSAALAARKRQIGAQIGRTATGRQMNQAYAAQAAAGTHRRGQRR